MKNKTIAILLAVMIGVGLLGAFAYKTYFATQTAGYHRNITDMHSPYNADAEVAQALEQMKKSQAKAAVITGGQSSARQVFLTFDGLTDRTTVQQILDLLKKYNAKATFFVDGLQTAEDPEIVISIRKEGHRIENYTLTGTPKMETLPIDRVIKDWVRAQKIIKVNTDQGPNLLKCNDTKYTEQLLQAAKACGFNAVVQSDALVNSKQINTLAKADAFVRTLRSGSIISVRLKTNTEPKATDTVKTEMKPAIDKQPGLKEQLPQADIAEDKALVEAVDKLLMALQRAKYQTAYVEELAKRSTKITFLPDSNKNKTMVSRMISLIEEQVAFLFSSSTAYAAEAPKSVEEIKSIATTEPALSFTFSGFAREEVVNDVLAHLHRQGIKATFFVAEVEMRQHPDLLRKVIDEGHEIGIAIRPKEGASFEETQKIITSARNLLAKKFGVTTNLVKQISGAVSDTTREVLAALGCELIGYSVNAVQIKHKDYLTADQVMAELFKKNVVALARGQIVHFRMDYYTNDRLVGDLVEAIKQQKVDNIAYATSFDNPSINPANNSRYAVKPVGQILHNTYFTYRYPADPGRIPPHLRSEGPVVPITDDSFIVEASKRYIGHKNVNYEDRMLGFSKMEDRRLDKSGVVHTNDNVVFITFDDWGSDSSINKLLYVLRKHNAKATFFILTNNVLINPNLLRAIAMEGHDIASHSDKHKPMAVIDPRSGKKVNTLDKAEYIKDFTTSYRKLRDVTGDVIVNGKPALTRFFRPPQLAISKAGFEALFEAGFEYIISGSTSTNDYKAHDVTELVETIKAGLYTNDGEVRKGAIFVMHMSDGSLYTAMALDILLTANAAKADTDPSKFKVGRLSDYIIDGYSQIERKKTLKLMDSIRANTVH